MIYLYGLIDNPSVSSDVFSNLVAQQSCTQTAPLSGWSLVYEVHDGSEVQPRRRNMLAHTRIVEHMMQFGTVLPARFGLVAQSIETVSQLIDRQKKVISLEFEKLKGCVELGVRLSFPRDAALAATLNADAALSAERDRLAGQGAEGYFARADFGRALAEAMDRRRGATQKTLITELRPLIRDYVLRSPDTDVEVLRLEMLIDSAREKDVIGCLETFARDCGFAPGAEPLIQVIGPAPSYNFVKLSLVAVNGSPEAA